MRRRDPIPGTHSVSELRDRHRGQDVYVLGAGNTLSYLDPGFFDGKVTVGVNEVALRWRPTTYVVTKYHGNAREAAAALPDVPVVVSYDSAGGTGLERPGLPPNIYVFDHLPNMVDRFDATQHWPDDPDALVVSWSTITSAMHFAAYLGAATVMVVAHDCGQLGDSLYVQNYQQGIDPRPFEPQSIGVKRQLMARYGCRVYSLNPFLNYNLEGVPYIGRNRINIAGAG